MKQERHSPNRRAKTWRLVVQLTAQTRHSRNLQRVASHTDTLADQSTRTHDRCRPGSKGLFVPHVQPRGATASKQASPMNMHASGIAFRKARHPRCHWPVRTADQLAYNAIWRDSLVVWGNHLCESQWIIKPSLNSSCQLNMWNHARPKIWHGHFWYFILKFGQIWYGINGLNTQWNYDPFNHILPQNIDG